jgi:hypothetical protein
MSTYALLLAAVVTFSPAARDARASAGRGASKTRVAVRGKTTTVVRGRGAARREVRLTTSGAACPAKARARVIAREVARHDKALSGGGLVNVKVAPNPRALATFEAGLVRVLRAGHADKHGRSFDGFSMKLGTLPHAGSTKTLGRGTTVTGQRGGGWVVVSTRTHPGGVVETVEATFGPGRVTTSFERSFAVATPGGGSVELTVGSEGFGVFGQGGSMGPSMGASSGLADQSSSGDGGSSGGESPSGGESGDDEQQNENSNPQEQGSVGLSSDGTFTASDVTVSNGAAAGVINWSRLGAAVGQPSPIEDAESTPSESDGSLCGAMAKPGFEPAVRYLEPNPQGHVSDPVESL